MKVPRKIFGDLVEVILIGGAKRATKYFDEKTVVKATRRGKLDKRDHRIEILFTVGTPNFKEREFIRNCKKAGEPFPVKKIQKKY